MAGDKAENEKFLPYFAIWRQFLSGEVSYIVVGDSSEHKSNNYLTKISM